MLLALSLSLPVPARAQDLEVFEREVDGLGFAVNVAFAPDGTMFVADKDVGLIRLVRDGELLPEPFAELPVLVTTTETGLLASLSTTSRGPGCTPTSPTERRFNRLVRIRADGDRRSDVQTLLDLLPATEIHNGGDMAFGPDGHLYLVTGDGALPEHAQDPASLGGKVLRLNPDGSVPPDNPFGPDDPVFALGIRNSFGLCFDPATGDLWETENGPESDDEVNRIVAGGNYGWPLQIGPGGAPGSVDPVVDFPEIVVPTGCAFDAQGEGLFFGGGYSGDLFRVDVDAGTASVVLNVDGGIIDVARAPDGSLRLVTPTAIYRSAAPASATASPSETASPEAGGGQGGVTTGAGVVVLALLVGGLLLMRTRLLRR
jgi:glucose/arabinose dehydrogenase